MLKNTWKCLSTILWDGNFKNNPSEFHRAELFYTLRAIVKWEAYPIVYALMQSCDFQDYEVVLGTLKTSLDTKIGRVGGLATSTTWYFDHESVMNVSRTTAGPPRVGKFLKYCFSASQRLKHGVFVYERQMKPKVAKYYI